MPSLLGIDNGLTVTKAVIYDVDGTQLSVARRRIPQSMPQPRHVERDMILLWQETADAIREALALSGRPSNDIMAVAATAHGDGLYLLDKEHQPLGAGILSLDSRASGIVESWSTGPVFEKALALTGQVPHVSAPSTLLAWIKQHEPARYRRIAHVLSCKDWLRFCLSGSIGTDRTEASTSFTEVQSQSYSLQVMELYQLEDLFEALPPVTHSAEIVGHVTAAAAKLTGLPAGVPVASGLHDVTASALGVGGHDDHVLSIVAGTYSINEVVDTNPHIDQRWMCRSAIESRRWNHMAISPASTANYDWFVDTFCRLERESAAANQQSIHSLLGQEVEQAMSRSSTVLFHPYLFGSPFGDIASGSFIGLRGWHDRGDMLKAVLEGIAFNHRTHVEALHDSFEFREVRLTGGGARNSVFAQMFADVLGLPVLVTTCDEPAAYGAAICAGTAIGIYPSVQDSPRLFDADARLFQPDSASAAIYDKRFSIFTSLAEVLQAQWPRIESLAEPLS